MHTITAHRIPATDPRLRRHVWHDSRSRNFPFDTTGLTIQSVQHVRHIPVLDQGNVGSCTGNAGIGCLGTDPYFPPAEYWAGATFGRHLIASYTLRGLPGQLTVRQAMLYGSNEAGAVALYSDAESIDGDGPYPPNDNGSSGLSVAKALHRAGMIGGYTHTFTVDDALKALSVTSFITGINWYNSMFSPDPSGQVRVVGALAGGHEIVVDGYDAERGLVWFTNSWGTGWGLEGRFCMAVEDYARLLGEQGDVTIFTPASVPVPQPQPAPTPLPPPPPSPNPDEAFAATLRPWVRRAAWFMAPSTANVKQAAKTWLKAKGL